MTEATSPRLLNEADIATRLKDLPGWRRDGKRLVRTYRTAGWKGTLMLVNTIGHLAEAAWHHPDLSVHYARVIVSLTTHDAGGLTQMDFALATKIESVVMWQPAREGEGLAGTPETPDAAYIIYE